MEMFSGIKKFAAGGRGDKQDHHEEKDKEEQSLTTILPTHEDRASLLLLVVESLDAMRAQLTNAFEAGDVTEVDPTKLEISGQSENALNVSEEKAAEQPAEQSTEEAAAKDKTEDAAQKAEQQAQKRREQLTKALAKEEFVALKKASIAHFDQWRENVLERVGGVVNQKADDDDPDMKKAKKVEEHRRNDNDQQQKPMTTKTGTATASQDDNGLVDLQKLYPPQPTPLRDLDDAHRVLVLHSLLLLFLGLETYQAESRVLMLRLASALAVPRGFWPRMRGR
ncbi:hypothetical protein PG995_012582 [Apiospora arundinis]